MGQRSHRTVQGGVSKLNEAREEVAKMQRKAGKKSKLLAEKQAEADEALKAITESMSVRKLERSGHTGRYSGSGRSENVDGAIEGRDREGKRAD